MTPEQRRIMELEERVSELEKNQARFLMAIKGAAEKMLQNPMVMAALPREMKEQIKKYIGEN